MSIKKIKLDYIPIVKEQPSNGYTEFSVEYINKLERSIAGKIKQNMVMKENN